MRAKRATNSALGILGLARRAGAVVHGTEAARRVLRDGSARLLLIACDASEVQRQKLLRLLSHRDVPWVEAGTRQELGQAIGSAPVTAIAVVADSFAKQMCGQLGIEAQPGQSVSDER